MNVPVKIAACGPLSGPRAAYGEMLQSLACANFGEQDGVSLLFYDDQAQPETAVAVARQALSDGCDLVIGHFNSYCSLAVQPIYQLARVPFIAPLATHQDLAFAQGGAIFCPSDRRQVELVMAKVLSRCARLTVIHDDSAYSENFITELRNTPVAVNLLPCEQSSQFRATDNSVVFLTGSHCKLIAPHCQLREAWPELTIFCCDDCFIEEYIDAVAARVSDNDFVIGQSKGHRGSLELALDYARYLLCDSPSENLFEMIGKSTARFSFEEDGRLSCLHWQLHQLASMTYPEELHD